MDEMKYAGCRFFKELIVLVILSFCNWSNSFAQQHSKCDNGIEILGGTTQYGFAVSPGFVRYLSDRLYLKLNPFYSKELDRNLYHYVYGLDFSVSRTLFRLPHYWYFNGVVGLGASYESGRFKERDFQQFDDLKFSTIIGFEVEKYFHKNWSAIVAGNQHIVTNTKGTWGFHRWYLTLGIRWHFYRLNRCNPTSTYIQH